MKPKDLKALFSWEERRPIIEDRIFHVPDRYEFHHAFRFPAWKDEILFGNEREVKIEFCSGNGKWILEKAQKEPLTNWVAVEWNYSRVRKIWSKIKNHGLTNLIVISGEALTFSSNYIPACSIKEIFINFPDPWPKTKHEKHRLMKPSFVQELNRILQENGAVTFVTDDERYLEWTLKHFLQSQLFDPLHPHPHVIEEKSGYGTSFFEELWRAQGKKIQFLELVKR